MPKLTQDITTTADVALSPKLQKQLLLRLDEYAKLVSQAKALKKLVSDTKDGIEMLFADEYEALENGVRVSTPMGEVPMKIIKGRTSPRLNVLKLMKKYKLTQKDLDSVKDPAKDKKPYLAIYLPGDEDEEE